MKNLLLILLVLFTTTTIQAKNYYISSTGSNSNTGLTATAPWQTIDKLNASFSSIAAGDSILFKCGQTFYGSILVSKSGTTTNPIIIGSYGTGAKPVISGLTTLSGWTNVSGNIWQATPGSILKKNVNVLTINGVPQAVGRTNWMVYQSASATQLTSSNITGTTYTGAEIVMKKNAFVAEKATVTAQSGSTVTYANNTQPINNGSASPLQAGRAGYGFFFQRFAGSLDQQGEWFFNKTTNKMQVYSTTNPSSLTIKASYVDTIINLNSRTNIIINNLSIEGAGIYGVESFGSTNVQIKNCSFNNNTKAIYLWNVNDALVANNTINNSFQGAVMVSDKQAKRINVLNNVITNTGQLIGMGVYNNEHSLRGIVALTDVTSASNYVNVIGNTVINTGNGGIVFQGSNVIVRRNITDTFCNQLQDNGGIYTFVSTTQTNTVNYINRIVDSNFISNAIGSPQGENGNMDVTGLYYDDQTLNVISNHNTIWNIPGNGIQLNDPLNMRVTDNTVYNCAVAVAVGRYMYGEIKGNYINRNVIYQKDSTQFINAYASVNLSRSPSQTITQALTTMANIDSNWISNLNFDSYRYWYSATGGAYTFPPAATLAQWKSNYSHEQKGVLHSIKVTATNTRLEYNASGVAKTVSFNGQSYIDAKGVAYDNSITIPAWSSVVLVSNGSVSAENISPVANAGSNIIITLPTNNTTLKGTSTDADGTISSNSWVKISGPSTGTIATANTATTTINNLVQGIYQYQLSVSDNKGAIGRDTIQVTVYAAVNKVPVADAGTDQTIKLPTSTTTLSGIGTDTDGTVSFAWAKISGPSSGTIETANAATTVIKNLTQGTYQYELTVTDNKGATAKSTVQVTVNTASNKAPVASAGADTTITLPINTITLTGKGTDTDGTVSGYAWIQMSGPSSATFETTNTASTTINNLVPGVYRFELIVTDNKEATAKDIMSVTVNAAAVQATVANAGTDMIVRYPANSTVLNGNGTSASGSISTYAWVKVSGPLSGKIAMADSASTLIIKLVEGAYQYELTVTDNNGATAKDTVNVTVQKSMRQAPVARAGNDRAITLPVNTTTLSGNILDNDSTVSNITWVKIAGPSSGTLATGNASTTLVNNMSEGVYQYELTVTGTNSAVGKDTVQVKVNAAVITNQFTNDNAGAGIKNEFKVYPNPVNDVANLTFTTNGNSKLSISITDMSGRVVKYNELVNLNKNKTVQLDMSGLSSGYYIITARFDDGQKFSSKVMKNSGK